MNNKFDVKKLIQISLLVALQIVLARFCAIQIQFVRIGLAFIPVTIIAIMFGPWSAGIANGIADILGTILFPTGAYFPGFTITAFLAGIIYGVFLHKKDMSMIRIILAVVIINLALNLGLNTLWLSILMGKGYMALLPARVMKTLIMVPIETVTIAVVWKQVVERFLRTSHA